MARRRAVIGVNIVDATPTTRRPVLAEIRGVLVSRFRPTANPGARAGIELGDMIVAVNDSAVDRVAQLQQIVGFEPGERVRVTVVRREGARTGVRRTFDVRLIAAALADRVLARLDVRDLARPQLRALVEATGETATCRSRAARRPSPSTSSRARRASRAWRGWAVRASPTRRQREGAARVHGAHAGRAGNRAPSGRSRPGGAGRRARARCARRAGRRRGASASRTSTPWPPPSPAATARSSAILGLQGPAEQPHAPRGAARSCRACSRPRRAVSRALGGDLTPGPPFVRIRLRLDAQRGRPTTRG